MTLNYINILKCPITGESLHHIDLNSLNHLNTLITQNNLFFYNKRPVLNKISDALLNKSKSVAYIIEDNIPILMVVDAIILDKSIVPINDNFYLDERHSIQTFYDEIGWKSQPSNISNFKDAELFEDLRIVSKNYIDHANSRITNLFNYSGKYFLDVASGPIQYEEYLNFSKNFEKRICVDISILALKNAREKLKDKGIYILADITNLPFKNNSICAAVSLHTIYHVPAKLQKIAFSELQRIIIEKGKCAIVYSYGSESSLMKLFMTPIRYLNTIRKLVTFKKSSPILYFHPYNSEWIKNLNLNESKINILVWRSVSVPFLKLFIHKFLFGELLLSLFSKFEDNYPNFFGKIGQYPLIVIEKKAKKRKKYNK